MICRAAAALAIAAQQEAKVAPDLKFEVASLKPSPPGGRGGGIRPSTGGERYIGTNVPLKAFIRVAWRIKDDQISGVLDYVVQNFAKEPFKELKTRNIPDKNPAAASADSIARGEQMFLLRCTGCHGRKADGKGPNSLDILPHPRNFRNHWFVESVPDRRLFESIQYGVQGTAMPSWIDIFTPNDVGDIVNFIRSLQNARK